MVIAVAGISFAGFMVHKKQSDKPATNENSSVTKQNTTPPTPNFNKLPNSWIEYKNNDSGLRLGYPSEWGILDTASSQTTDYRDDKKNLEGTLSISISNKQGFSVVTQKYGVTISPSSDGKKWTVLDANPANPDNYKVGDTYRPRIQNVNGGKIIDFSYTEEVCTHTKWLMELKNSYVTISIPSLCPVGLELIPETNKTSYDQIKADLLKTITIY